MDSAEAIMGQWMSNLRRIRLGCPDEMQDRTVTIDMMTSVYDLYPYVYSSYKPSKHVRAPVPDIAKKVYLHCCNIENIEADCIVNAANASLQPGSGVCGAIFRKGGPELTKQVKGLGSIEPGEVYVTKGAGDLKVKYVIHAVGPDRSSKRNSPVLDFERQQLSSAYANSLRACTDKGCGSIAFPSISTGIFNFPTKEAYPIAMTTIRAFLSNARASRGVTAVIIVAYTSNDYKEMLPHVLDLFRPYDGAPPGSAS